MVSHAKMTVSTFPGSWTVEQYSIAYHIIVTVSTINAMAAHATYERKKYLAKMKKMNVG